MPSPPATLPMGEGRTFKGAFLHSKTMLARELRKAATREEVIVWKVPGNRKFCNLKFKRQYVIEGFVVDYYCHELNLAI